MSYVIDLYFDKVEVQKNIISFGTYVTMFPQLVAGPIVQYGDIAKQLNKRKESSVYAWSPQTYACAVKRGDQDWLNFVNTALHEAMTGVEFPTYKASFKQWFGVDLPEPAIGFPVEFK